MDLFKYWSLDEAIDRVDVLSEVKKLKKEGKIDYQLDGDILKIEDIDMSDSDIEDLLDVFDENDVFEYLEGGDDDDLEDYEDDDYDY